jgi:hypothetical protein
MFRVRAFSNVHADDLAACVDSKSRGACSTRDIDRGEISLVQQKATYPLVELLSNDLAARIDSPDIYEPDGARYIINCGEVSILQQKAMICESGIGVHAHDLTARVEPTDFSRQGTGNIDYGKVSIIQQKAMCPAGITVVAYDLTLVIYPLDTSRGRAGNIDRSEVPIIQQKALELLTVNMVADDLAACVDSESRGVCPGRRS